MQEAKGREVSLDNQLVQARANATNIALSGGIPFTWITDSANRAKKEEER